MTIGFGRVVIDGVEHVDPYVDGLEKLESFVVVSNAGGTYSVKRLFASDPRRWRLSRDDAGDSVPSGSVAQAGNPLARFYNYYREGHALSSGRQSLLINAVFSLIE